MISRTWIAGLLGLVSFAGAGETVGTVVTPGGVLLNGLAVQGNAIIAEGAVLRTTAAAARVELSGGGVIALDAGSEAVVERERVQLRRGRGMVASEAGRIEALGFRIQCGAPESQVLVGLSGGKVEVAAIRGAGRVKNAEGLMLAMVRKGKALSFEPAAGGNESTLTGKLRREGNRFLVRDELTGVEIELRGNSLKDNEGRRIQATGESRVAGDRENQVVLVSRLNRLEEPGEPGKGETTGSSSATKSGTAAESGGMSAGAKIAVAALAFGGMATAISVPLAMSN